MPYFQMEVWVVQHGAGPVTVKAKTLEEAEAAVAIAYKEGKLALDFDSSPIEYEGIFNSEVLEEAYVEYTVRDGQLVPFDEDTDYEEYEDNKP